MWSTKQKLLFGFYRLFASWLPESRHLPLAKSFRYFWGKRIAASVGKNVNFEKNCSFTPGLHIGNNSGIGIRCEINGTVYIGDNVLMGPEVVTYTKNHQFKDPNTPIFQQGFSEEKPIVIGNDIWIGRSVIILPGVHIGDGCIIGAGAVVTKSFPQNCVIAGVPAKRIGKR